MDLMTLALMGAVFVGAYFLMIRPQQKRLREQQEQAAKIAEGERVMLTSGVFGTVRHLGTKQAVIEVSPGVELTVVRQAIVRIVPAEEEEFEYADSETTVEAGSVAPAATIGSSPALGGIDDQPLPTPPAAGSVASPVADEPLGDPGLHTGGPARPDVEKQ